MTVVQSPPPVTSAGPSYDDEENVHSVFFWLALMAAVCGIASIALSRAWSTYAPRFVHLIAYNQTVDLRGTLTYHVDPKNLVPTETPQALGLDISQHTFTVGQPDSQNTIMTRSEAVTIDGANHVTFLLQYLVNVSDLHNVDSSTAWAYAGPNSVNRALAYTVNFPFDMGSGPFPFWADEVGRPFSLTQVGAPFQKNGLTLVRLRGHVDAAPVDPLYVQQAGHAAIPAQMTLRQLSAATGVDFAAFLPVLGQHLTVDEGTAMDASMPLDYTMSGDITLLAEPKTGTIVAVESEDKTFSATVDRSGGGLAVPRRVLEAHRDVPGDAAALVAVDRLMSASPTPVYDLHYAQTPDSVKSMSDYASGQRDWVDRIRNGIPRMLLIAGMVLIVTAVVSGAVAWRRRGRHTVEPGG